MTNVSGTFVGTRVCLNLGWLHSQLYHVNHLQTHSSMLMLCL